jgi:peptide-methionine (S)-S-oxide reductase
MIFSTTKLQMPARDQALKGREDVMRVDNQHAVKNATIKPPFPDGHEQIVFGGRSASFGSSRGFIQRRWGMQQVIRQTQLMKRCAVV